MKIAENTKLMEKWGFGLSKKEVLTLIGRYVKENNIETQFKDGIPGDDYFVRFKRTFNLSQKKPQIVEVTRKRSVDPFIMDDYFTLLKDVIQDIPPSRIYNIDETSLCLDPSRIKVLEKKTSRYYWVQTLLEKNYRRILCLKGKIYGIHGSQNAKKNM